MGLINEVNNIGQEIKTQNQEKEQKRIEKIKKDIQKRNLERIKAETIQFLKNIFQESFTEYGSSYEIEFLNIDRKAEILKQCKKELIGESINDLTNSNFNIEESRKLIEIFNKNYYKILKEQKTIFLNNEKYLQYKAQQEAEQIPKETQKIDIWNILEKIINIILKIILVIFGGLFFLVGCALKSVK